MLGWFGALNAKERRTMGACIGGRALGSFLPTLVGFVSQSLPLGATIAVFSAFASALMIVMLMLETRGRSLQSLDTAPTAPEPTLAAVADRP